MKDRERERETKRKESKGTRDEWMGSSEEMSVEDP